jgi:uncharacterized OB-fold protein
MSKGAELAIEPPELTELRVQSISEYSWSTGEVTGSFLGALQKHGKILGAVCSGCGRVAAPPLSYCESCGSGISDYKEVGPRGVVMSWAGAPGDTEGAPLDGPFRFILVRLAGADTEMVHLAPDDERIRIGAAVRPEFRPAPERTGSITDIRWFIPDESGPDPEPGER